MGDALTMDHKDLAQLMRSFAPPPACAVSVAGPPCTDVSRLKRNRLGAHGPESGKLQPYVALMRRLGAELAGEAWPLVGLTENVGSMDEKDRQVYDTTLGVPAIVSNAADWGWVHRTRHHRVDSIEHLGSDIK